MGQDLIKYKERQIDLVIYPAFLRRVYDIEGLIPGLNDAQRVSLVESSVLSLTRETHNPTGDGISPMNNAVLRFLIKKTPPHLQQQYVDGSGRIFVKKVDTQDKLMAMYRSTTWYAENINYITIV